MIEPTIEMLTAELQTERHRVSVLSDHVATLTADLATARAAVGDFERRVAAQVAKIGIKQPVAAAVLAEPTTPKTDWTARAQAARAVAARAAIPQ